MDVMTESDVRRFWDKVIPEPNTGCWLWIGGLDTRGYGNFNASGTTRRASKIALELHTGRSMRGVHVLHRCDVRSCCNPGHLFEGTNADNVADKVKKGRQSKKLSDAQVLEIRAAYDRREENQYALADRYGVRQSQISRIINGVRRKHTQGVA